MKRTDHGMTTTAGVRMALMAALTQGRNFLLRNVDKRTQEARDDLFGEEHESDFFLLMRAWRYADKANYNPDACRRIGIHIQGVRAVGPLFEIQLNRTLHQPVFHRRKQHAPVVAHRGDHFAPILERFGFSERWHESD